ncbi:hypothetical protein C0995_012381 [Termitomyces sp. Mi166|nr:hypothetical protein C0995_012381 [Termitomyces sp. Mi166\
MVRRLVLLNGDSSIFIIFTPTPFQKQAPTSADVDAASFPSPSSNGFTNQHTNVLAQSSSSFPSPRFNPDVDADEETPLLRGQPAGTASLLEGAFMLLVLVPFALVRDIAKLSSTALLANTFIISGLLYVFSAEVSLLSSQGVADVKMFNPKDFPLLIGTAVFSFQAIGLFIPITDSLREPRKFSPFVKGVITAVTLVLGIAGSLGYLAFGSKIETVILINLDSSRLSVQAVQFFYTLAIFLSIPLQFLPAVDILENWIFGSSSYKLDVKIKRQQDAVRIGLAGCALDICVSADVTLPCMRKDNETEDSGRLTRGFWGRGLLCSSLLGDHRNWETVLSHLRCNSDAKGLLSDKLLDQFLEPSDTWPDEEILEFDGYAQE